MKKSMALLKLVAVGALILLIVFPTPVLAQTPNYFHSIVVKKSGLCLDVEDGDTTDSANVWQWPYNGTDAQLWRLKPSIDGYYNFVAKKSGKCLDVEGGDTTKGANIQQYTCNGTDAQLWSLGCNDNGYCSIVSKNSGMCLDVEGGDITKGTNVQQYTCNETDAQLWKLIAKGDVDANGELGIGDAITALKVSAGMDAEVSRNADLDGDGKISVKDANYMLVAMANKVGETIDKRFAGVYYVDKPDRSTHTETGLYPLVVETNGDVYIKGDKIRYRYDRWGNILVFDLQYINDDLKKGQIVFSDYPDGKNRFDGTIVSSSDGEPVAFSGTQMLKTQIWATPTSIGNVDDFLSSGIVGGFFDLINPIVDLPSVIKPIGDHTWITMMRDEHCWRVLGGDSEDWYCTNETRWKTIGNTRVYYPRYEDDPDFGGRVARLLDSTAAGDAGKIDCMGGNVKAYLTGDDILDILGISEWYQYAGIVYALNGVCHQMTNRLLLGAGNLTVEGADRFVESTILFGVYGTTIPTSILEQIPTGEVCTPEVCTGGCVDFCAPVIDVCERVCLPNPGCQNYCLDFGGFVGEVCQEVCIPEVCTPEECTGPLNPVYLALVEMKKGLESDFLLQCNECEVNVPDLKRTAGNSKTGMSAGENFADEVLSLHQERKIFLPRDTASGIPPEQVKAFLLENHEIHMKELKLLFEHKAGNSISYERMDKILALYDEMQRPSERLLNNLADIMSKSEEELQAMKKDALEAMRKRISEASFESLQLTEKINKAFNAQQKRVADFLTYDEYITLFDHGPDEHIDIVNPRMMTGNSK